MDGWSVRKGRGSLREAQEFDSAEIGQEMGGRTIRKRRSEISHWAERAIVVADVEVTLWLC